MKNILITGGEGYLGNFLKKKYIKSPIYFDNSIIFVILRQKSYVK